MIRSFLLDMVGYCLISLPFYMVIRMLYMRKQNKNWPREIVMMLFFLYCVSIFSQTIIPNFYIDEGRIIFDTSNAFIRSNFTPLTTIHLYYDQLDGPIAQIAFYNLVGNIVLFIPFGFFIPLLWKKLRSWRKMHIIAFGIPLFIECTQYFIGRSIDVDDVLLNAIAIVLGFVMYKVLHRLRKFVIDK
ncbi:VanZ family protein [Solibacillus daqui]|uniref:VanZ family protein n=1 Tax=Solibacillus daqui TaxID=2912187 RepID=UPI0023668248|nr:VanZ family protein [Solibacillus daqui]